MRYLLLLLMGINYTSINAQLAGCTSPGLPPCMCSTAEVLCDVQQLDGVTYQMSTQDNSSNAPSYFCYVGDQTAPHNATWYAFPAWCPNLDLQITYTNCSGSVTSRGLQAAVYSNCNNLPGSIVTGGCGAEWSCPFPFTNCVGCGVTNGVRTLNMTGLTPGATYYLLVDGCGGSACTVNIKVVSPPCPPTINTPAPPQGPLTVCAGQNNTYTGVLPMGATLFYWYVNGELILAKSTDNFFIYNFPTAGQYQVCLDVANDCVDVSSPPSQQCITVNAYSPNAGALTAQPNPTCPGNTIDYSVSGFTQAFSNFLVLANSAGQIIQVTSGTSGSFTHNTCAQFTLYSYNFQAGTLQPPVVGNNISSINCSGLCCASVQIPLNFTDNEPPSFVNPPADITLNCYLNLPPMNNLDWIDNCFTGGTVMGTQMSNFTNCGGGTITRTWSATDGCNNTRTHIQTITLDPIPVATFNAPPDITISCQEIPPPGFLPEISFNNGVTGDCAITGTLLPQRTDVINNCSGTITFVWSTTDLCGRAITHTQIMTVEPPSTPVFVNAPADLTVDCATKPDASFLPTLNYTNNESGNCLITGTGIIPNRVENINNCSGTITYTWTITDPCNRTITHVQVYTVNPQAAPIFINPPSDQTISCSEIPPASPLPTLNFSNGETGNCEIIGQVTATRQENIINCAGTITYTWQYNDPCGRSLSHTQTLTVNPPALPVFNNPPANMNISCSEIPSGPLPTLSISNGETGNCLISSSVTATQTNNITNCAGTITYLWTFTDPCNRTIMHEQVLTLSPPAEAMFVNPPANVTISCDQLSSVDPSAPLSYTNGLIGSCEIMGNASAVTTQQIVNCAGTITRVWNATDACGRALSHTQTIMVQAPPPAQLINPPTYNNAITCQDASSFAAPDISFSNNFSQCPINGNIMPLTTPNFDACGGNIQIDWDGLDACDRPLAYNQIILVQKAPAPVFTSQLPADITVACSDINQYLIPLTYSNSLSGICQVMGSVIPDVSQNISLCGGSATLTWSYNDNCGNMLNHQQIITVQPAPQAAFINPPPANITLACDQVPLTPPVLNYSNGQSGLCEISGGVQAIQTGGYNSCGGLLQYTWQFTDPCGRPLVYTQNITVLPSAAPFFINPPQNYFLPCGITFQNPEPLEYTNGFTDACGFNGTISPATSFFGTYFINTWTLVNPCNNNVITATQRVDISPSPDILINPASVTICEGQSFNLNTINVTDLSGNTSSITYHNGSPAGSFNQMPFTNVTPFSTTSYTLLATNAFGCTDEATFTIDVIQAPISGTPIQAVICIDNQPLNLWNYIFGYSGNNGFWTDVNNTGVNLDNPAAINISNVSPGTYAFDYTLPSESPQCPSSTTRLNVEFTTPGSYSISSVECSADFNNYTITITTSDFSVSPSAGSIFLAGPGLLEVRNIPISQSVLLTFTSIGSNCAPFTLTVSPPDCNCPSVAPPVSGPVQRLCEGGNNPGLNVIVPPGLTSDWYSASTGGVLLQSNTQSYIPTVSMPGLYSFWVESIDSGTGCKSSTRTQVQFEIIANPQVMNAILKQCDNDNDGIASFNLTGANALISGNPNHNYSYYSSMTDALSETNALTPQFTNTVAGGQTIFVLVKNSSNCRAIAELTLEVLPQPVFDLEAVNESCLGSGNGSISVNPNGGNPPFQFQLDNNPFQNTGLYQNLVPKNYIITVRDQNQCQKSANITLGQGQRLEISTFSSICNNNGTLSEGSDDFYRIEFLISSSFQVNNTFIVVFNGTELGEFDYNEESFIELPANGIGGMLEFIDKITGCKVTRSVNPLISCSTTCQITVNGLAYNCNDMGTESDPDDDFYTISFSTSVFNGGADNTFNLLVDGLIVSSHSYGQTVTFTLEANSSVPDVVVRDNQNILCQTPLILPALSPCSGKCVINAGITNIICNDSGTINDPEDDTFSFTIRVSGSNTSAGWILQGDNSVRPYNTNVVLGPFPISGGNLSLTISDNDDNQCTTVSNIVAPPPCSAPCVLNLQGLQIGICNNSGTGNTEADDRFNISFSISIASGSASIYRISNGIREWGPFIYGNTVTIDDLPADGSTITLRVLDQSNPGCNFTFNVSQNPCSQCNQTADAGPDVVLSCQVNTAQLNGSSSSPGILYRWTGPNNFVRTGQSVQTTTPGVYYFTVTFADQCVATDSVTVTADADLPVADAGQDGIINCIVSEVILSGTSNIPAANALYEWTDLAGNVISSTPNLTVSIPGIYFLQVSNTLNNCVSGKDEVSVIDDRDAPIAVIYADPGNLLDCVISGIILSGEPQENVYFDWQVGEITYSKLVSIVVTEEGLVTMIAVDSISGCSASSQLNIIDLQDYPILTVEPAAPITCDNNQSIISASGSPGGPNLIFSWYDSNNDLIPGQNGAELIVNTPGTYYVVLTDTLNKCSNADTILVESIGDFPDLTLPEDVNLFCGENQVSLEIQIRNNQPNTQITWSNSGGNILSGASTERISVQGAGQYIVEVTFPDSGCNSVRTINVNVNEDRPDNIIVEVENESCGGNRDASITIESISGGTPPYNIKLNNQNYGNNTSITSLAPGNYNLLITDSNGCTLNRDISLDAGNNLDLALASNIEIKRGDTVTLEVKVNIPESEIQSVKWSPTENLSCDTCLITQFTGFRDIEYEVSIIDFNGCESTARVKISVNSTVIITVPNIFNPQSNRNNYFSISANNGVELIEKLRIFDRWGNLLFSNENFAPNIPEAGWDGKYKGQDVTPGVYVFYIEYRTTTGIDVYSGDVTVIR